MGSDNIDADSRATARSGGGSTWRTHATLACGLALCAAAFWFELRRAVGGNGLSWAYVFEWPLLALFAVYMWWKVLHPIRDPSPRRAKKTALAPEFDGMLVAWQEHQEQLHESRVAREQEAP